MFEIKSKCATVNWQKSTKFTKRTPNKIGCDVSVKQMFRTWMKTLLHCGFGQTQVNQITYEPIHSAQAQSVRVMEKISFGFVGRRCCDISKSKDKRIFYLYFRINSLRFQL